MAQYQEYGRNKNGWMDLEGGATILAYCQPSIFCGPHEELIKNPSVARALGHAGGAGKQRAEFLGPG